MDLNFGGVEQLERFAEQRPEEPWLRFILLLGYIRHRHSQTALRSIETHALWIIEHATDSSITGELGLLLFKSFQDNGAFYERAKRLWTAALAAHPRDLTILGNAAQFFCALTLS